MFWTDRVENLDNTYHTKISTESQVNSKVFAEDGGCLSLQAPKNRPPNFPLQNIKKNLFQAISY